MTQRYVMLAGQIYRWEEKAPFTKSGRSLWGAFEVDLSSGKTKCHECGEWYQKLGTHVRRSHDISQYRETHNLRKRTLGINHGYQSDAPKHIFTDVDRQKARQALVAHRQSAILHHSTGEFRNVNGTCIAQMQTQIGAFIGTHGRLPASHELPAVATQAKRQYGSWNRFLVSIGHDPVRTYRQDDELLESLRDFYYLNRRFPLRREWGHGRLPAMSVFCKRFGGIRSAYAAAGLALQYARTRQHFKKTAAYICL